MVGKNDVESLQERKLLNKGGNKLPPSMLRMQTLSFYVYDSTRGDRHCPFPGQGEVEISLPHWDSRVCE